MADTRTITALDPETGDEDTIEVPVELGGWELTDEPGARGTIVWEDPDDPDHYVGWEKTGGHTWAAFYRGGAEDEFKTAPTALDAIMYAKQMLRRRDPRGGDEDDA